MRKPKAAEEIRDAVKDQTGLLRFEESSFEGNVIVPERWIETPTFCGNLLSQIKQLALFLRAAAGKWLRKYFLMGGDLRKSDEQHADSLIPG